MAPSKHAANGQPNWKMLKMQLSSATNKPLQKKQGSQLKTKKKDVKRRKIYEEAVRALEVTESKKPVSKHITNVCAIDCEFVGVGHNGVEDQLARVSIVNEMGEAIYDKYVKPMEPVVDYRTVYSGIQPGHLVDAPSFDEVQKQVHKLIANKIVVGHGVSSDFRVLKITHPTRLTRDTAKYRPFRKAIRCTATPALRLLAEKLLGIRIQSGEHDSVVDARTALRLYLLHRKNWETQVKQVRKR